ncbi:MAG: outer membrane beta-barrel protein [Bacteroidia bacterium]|nr:outer membrane beta-barrel protein [Bacteroidia bacterium]
MISIRLLCDAQKIEYSVQVGSGLFSFGGKSSTRKSTISLSDIYNISNYTNNPYGKLSGFSYSITAQAQKLTRINNIIGLQLGYESLSSKVMINDISSDLMYLDESRVTGQTYLINHFINLFPYFGQRLIICSLKVDLTAGTDISFCTGSKEDGIAEYYSSQFKADLNRNYPTIDFRLRAGLTCYYKHTGLSAGYSYGLTNYSPILMGVYAEEYSRLFRFGIIYRI